MASKLPLNYSYGYPPSFQAKVGSAVASETLDPVDGIEAGLLHKFPVKAQVSDSDNWESFGLILTSECRLAMGFRFELAPDQLSNPF